MSASDAKNTTRDRLCGSCARNRFARAVLVAILAAAAAIALPAPSNAATYTVHSCRLPDGRFIPFTGWSPSVQPAPQPGAGTEADCARDALVAWVGEGDGTPVGTYAQWAFQAPADTEIASYRLDREAAGSSGVVFRFTAALAGYRLVARNRSAEELELESCPPWGGPSEACDDLAPVAEGTLPAGAVELAAIAGCLRVDGGSECPEGEDDASAWVAISAAEVDLDDASPPQLLQPLSGGVVAGPTLVGAAGELRVAAADRGGGIRAVTVELDGTPLRTFTFCTPPFTDPVPCPLTVDRALPVDLAGVPAGQHVLRALVTDATGANVTASEPRRIDVVGSPRARLTARVVVAHERRAAARGPRTVAYGRGARLVGTLTTPEGRAIAGATLAVWSRIRGAGQPWRQAGTVTTDPRGRYSGALARGPSRDLRVTYRPLPQLPTDSAAARVRLAVRAPVRLAVPRAGLTEGGTMRFAGRLAAGPRPRRGKLVLLQVRDRGAWRTFATVRADRARGRFAYRYGFPALGATRTYRFRALSPAESSYPYATGASPTVRVTVHRAR
ncbi:MAG TPA: hypothetical protein VGF25_07960 [Thermoleophilaceae bacterium]|jgi:hypothetical protein